MQLLLDAVHLLSFIDEDHVLLFVQFVRKRSRFQTLHWSLCSIDISLWHICIAFCHFLYIKTKTHTRCLSLVNIVKSSLRFNANFSSSNTFLRCTRRRGERSWFKKTLLRGMATPSMLWHSIFFRITYKSLVLRSSQPKKGEQLQPVPLTGTRTEICEWIYFFCSLKKIVGYRCKSWYRKRERESNLEKKPLIIIARIINRKSTDDAVFQYKRDDLLWQYHGQSCNTIVTFWNSICLYL